MKKSSINPMPKFFDRYIHLVKEENLFDAFYASIEKLKTIDIEVLNKIGNKTYQEGKWTINDIMQHIIDNERVQSYRAMRFSRKDPTSLLGYDENLLAQNAFANKRPLNDLIDELYVLRKSTIQLFKSFDKSVYNHSGICFNQTITVTALGFVIVGHQLHHLRVIEERYIPLLNQL